MGKLRLMAGVVVTMSYSWEVVLLGSKPGSLADPSHFPGASGKTVNLRLSPVYPRPAADISDQTSNQLRRDP